MLGNSGSLRAERAAWRSSRPHSMSRRIRERNETVFSYHVTIPSRRKERNAAPRDAWAHAQARLLAACQPAALFLASSTARRWIR